MTPKLGLVDCQAVALHFSRREANVAEGKRVSGVSSRLGRDLRNPDVVRQIREQAEDVVRDENARRQMRRLRAALDG